MAPKTAKPTKGKQKPQEEQREELLQAVVLADSFETRFRPFTRDRPRCLLPLANTPLIEYTLEFLANAGVQDVFICCGSHTEQLEDYINNSRWRNESSPFETLLLLKSPANSIGDAMRDLEGRSLDGRSLITRDFLLVSGDVVSNIPLQPILSKHRARREVDKNAIMTMVLREAGVKSRVRSKARNPLFVVNPKTGRCLHYEETGSRDGSQHRLSPDSTILKGHKEIEIRGDLIDCYIDICTPDVLGLWSDNFDYSSLRSSFLHGVLKDFELNGKTIYTAVIQNHYATRVKNLRAYDVVSKDILGRRTYPLCPDSNLLPDQSYQFQKGDICKEDISVARSSTLKRRVVVGERTRIQGESHISDSSLGRNCHIGSQVDISHSYIWDDVKIGDGTKIQGAVIASGATIGDNCSIYPGALISFGAHVAGSTVVAGSSRITIGKWKRQDNSSQSDLSQVGERTGTDLAPESSDDDSDASSLMGSPSNQHSRGSLTDPSISELSESDSDLESSPGRSRRSSFLSNPSSDSAPNRDFHLEATGDIFDSLQNGVSSENISLELVSLRMKEDASQHQVRHAVVAAFMRRLHSLMGDDGQPAMKPPEAVKEVFAKNKEVLRRVLFDQAEEMKSDQVDLLMLLQRDVSGRPKSESLLPVIAMELYQLDLLEEDGIMQWWEDDRSSSGEPNKVRESMQPFIDFLQTAEEESDGSEDDSDE